MDAQADLSLRWLHKSYCRFCHALAQIIVLTLCMHGNLIMTTIRVANNLDPDQARLFVGPDLGPNCLQKLSADDKSRH